MPIMSRRCLKADQLTKLTVQRKARGKALDFIEDGHARPTRSKFVFEQNKITKEKVVSKRVDTLEGKI